MRELPSREAGAATEEEVVVAIPKGRVLDALVPLLEEAGLDSSAITKKGRSLIRREPRTGARFLLLKPDDVPTYVEYGTADIGVVGRDVLMEREYDLYIPIDLGIGVCRLAVAGLPERPARQGVLGRPLRVATKFPNLAARHFARKGQQVETVFVQGSVELAPLTGLADLIVDLVESGETLRQNGLVEYETVCSISSVVVANRVGLKLKRTVLAPLLAALRGAAEAA